MLLRKMWRDLLQNKTQFISIFLMSLLAMFVYVGIDSETNGGTYAAKTYYERYNLANYWVQGNGFSDDEVRAVEAVKGVRNVEKRLYVTGTTVNYNEAFAYINFLTDEEISRLMLYEGEPYEPEADGVWLEKFFADANNIQVGDLFSLKIDGYQIDAIVKGIVDSPEYVYYVSQSDMMMPNYDKCCLVFLSETSFPNRDYLLFNQLLVDTEDDVDEASIKNAIADAFDRTDITVIDRSQNSSYQMFDDEMTQHKAMGVMFASVFVAIALLGIITTMTRVTSNQRTQIGTLKALGLSKGVITIHYVSYGFFLSLTGGVIGAFLGDLFIGPWILSMFVGSYILPNLTSMVSSFDIFIIVISVAISTLVSFLACRKELKDPPAITLKPPAPKKVKTSWFEKSRLWLALSFSVQWNIRDIKRNIFRSLMGIIGVVGCSMLIASGFGCKDAINDLVELEYGHLITANNKIMLGAESSFDYAYDLSKKYSGQMVEEAAIELVSESRSLNGTAVVLDKGNYLHYQDENFNNTTLTKNGIAMTAKMAENLGLELGDYVRWHIVGDDTWQYTRIVQLVREPLTQGIVMYRSEFESMEYDFNPTSIYTNMTVDKSLTDDDEVATVLNTEEMIKAFNDNVEIMNAMVFIMVFFAILLGFVVLYNLGVLSFVEKTREMATLKVLGLKTSKIRGILQQQNIWLTFIGIWFGLYAGYKILYVICTTASESMDMYPSFSVPTYIYTIVGTFMVSILVNFMFSSKVKTINMVEALKGVE